MTLRYSSPGVRARLVAGELVHWIESHKRKSYVRASYLALVPWADRERLKEIYEEARRLGRVVDHRIPLCHPLVCGLTVPDNLRVVDRLQNARESNFWSDRIDDMFNYPEQLRLC